MANLRSDDGFAWIARSVVIICGTAFLLVCLKSFYQSYTRFHVVGAPTSVVAESKTEDELSQKYWQSYFYSKLTPGTQLRVNDLEAFQRELLQTGYFSKIEFAIVDELLRVGYALHKRLAFLQHVDKNREKLDTYCLYESAKLLANLQGSSSQELCELQLPKLGNENELQTFLEVLTDILKQLDLNTQVSLTKKHTTTAGSFSRLEKPKPWWVKSIDASNWFGFECPCSEIVLGFESNEGKVIWMRLGAFRLEDSTWLAGTKIIELLEFARLKQAIWIDARLEDLVGFKLSTV